MGEIIDNRPIRSSENLFPGWPAFSDETISNIQEPLRSGKVSYWTGDYGKKFEESFSQYCNVLYSYCVNSATSGLFISLLACQIGPGDEVIVPSCTFVATATSVLMANAIPIFADIDPETLTISCESIERNITSRTKAIIPVHLNGHPAEMDEIMAIARKYNLAVIEDASQALGAKYKDKKVGSIGDIGVFSFCQDKTITTGGEGGMITTNNADYAKKLNSLRSHGFVTIGKRNFMESQRIYPYIFNHLGYNFRMTEIQAVIGLTEMKRLESWNLKNRRRNAQLLSDMLKDVPEVRTPVVREYVEHGFYKYPLLLKMECFNVGRGDIISALAKEGLFVEPGDTPDNYRQNIFQQVSNYTKYCPFACPYNNVDANKYKSVSVPIADSIGKQIIRIKIHPTLSVEDIKDTALIIKKVISHL